mgnify:FL=1
MTYETLKSIFENSYPGKKEIFEKLVSPIFNKARDLTSSDRDFSTEVDSSKIKSCTIFAQVGGAFPITFADVELKENVSVKTNRVAIQNCVRRILDNNTNAIIFFHQPESTEWRVSYVHRGSSNKDSTNAKRYTYLCGKNHACRTVSERFLELTNVTRINDEVMLKAFSVATLSDEFFDEYKVFYEDFVQFITGNRYLKKGGKNKWEKIKIHEPNKDIFPQFIKIAQKELNSTDEDIIIPLAQKLVRDYIKKLMGRLVFLQFLQKRGWLGVPKNNNWGDGDKNYIQNLFSNSEYKEDFLDKVLETLFFDTLNIKRDNDICESILGNEIKIPYLNGGLFEKDMIFDSTNIKFPKEFFSNPDKKEVERKFAGEIEDYPYTEYSGILDFFGKFNFTIDETDPYDQEIGVDPEMLGKIFENLLEDNKDKGAFYTPKEIVQYMCRESLIAYLLTDSQIEGDKIRDFVINHTDNFLDEEKAEIKEKLGNVKICDPAVGSGAFPMGMLNELYACRHIIENDLQPVKIKEEIVKNNIYGVDIEKGAVDIARLRFWLAIIVDEDEPKPLPNLDYKIMQGNSLLECYEGIDLSNLLKIDESDLFSDNEAIYSLLDAIKGYYIPNDSIAKDKIRKQIEERIIELLDKTGISGEKFEKLKKIDLHENNQFFLWHTWFNDVFNRPNDCNGGFDIVNPPYIKEYENKNAFDGFRENSPYYMGKMDLWYGFACHGLDLLRKNGHLCFIAQNNWTTSAGAKLLRKKIVDSAKICQLLDFNTYMVFESASIQTMIMLFQNNSEIDNYTFDCRTLCAEASKTDMIDLLNKTNTKKNQLLSPSFNRVALAGKLLTFSENDLIFEKISDGKLFLNDKEATNGIHTHHDCVNNKMHNDFPDLPVGKGIFVLSDLEVQSLNFNENEKELIKPYFISTQILKYYTNKNNTQWIIYTDSSFRDINKITSYPKIKEHLDSVKIVITSDNKPYGLHRSREEHFFKGEKIISQRKCVDSPLFSYSDFDCYVPAMYYIIQTSRWNMKFLTGLLNSKLVAFWLKHKGKMQGANYQVDKEPLLTIPLPNPETLDKNIEMNIIKLVENIISTKKDDISSNTSIYESEIDRLVYKLYGLNEDEVAIIENK